MPEMRGEPSARSVAIVLWRPASNNRRTRPANSGSASSKAFHPGMARSVLGRPPAPVGQPLSSGPGEAQPVGSGGSWWMASRKCAIHTSVSEARYGESASMRVSSTSSEPLR